MTDQRGRGPSGQTLPLFALMLPAMLALMALGLDGAQIFLERRDAQGAADLASLAGVKHLPDNAAAAEAAAIVNAAANGFTITVADVVTPYDGDDERIEVTIPSSVDTFFLSVLDVWGFGDYSTVPVDARAVAQIEQAVAYGDAIFAAEDACPDDGQMVLEWTGENIIIDGGVHSNGGIAAPPQYGEANGGTTYTCDGYFDDRGGVVFDPSEEWNGGAAAPWPETYTLADFTCTPFADAPADGEWNVGADEGSWWVGGRRNATSPPTLVTGTYCATGPNGRIKLSGAADVVGQVTFIATQTVDLQINGGALTPNENGVLVYSTDGNVIVSGNASTLDGLIYAPDGTATVSGNNSTVLTGGVHAWNVVLSGNGFEIVNEIEGGGPPSLALVE